MTYERYVGNENLIINTTPIICHHEVRCYKPNKDGVLVLTKKLNVKHRPLLECGLIQPRNKDKDGNRIEVHFKCQFKLGPNIRCGEGFYCSSPNAKYCPKHRDIVKSIVRQRSLDRNRRNEDQ